MYTFYKSYLKNTLYILLIWIGICCFSSTPLSAQLASPVFDGYNNFIGSVAMSVAKTSRAIREDILPFKETISKVQSFFKDTKTKVNAVVVNLKMTQQVIEMESKISQLFLQSLQQMDEAQNVPYIWKHRWVLAQLWYESRNILEVFDFSYLEEKGIMDDQQRITLIKETLKKLRKVHAAMRLKVRRTQRLEYKIKTKQREIGAFTNLFQ